MYQPLDASPCGCHPLGAVAVIWVGPTEGGGRMESGNATWRAGWRPLASVGWRLDAPPLSHGAALHSSVGGA